MSKSLTSLAVAASLSLGGTLPTSQAGGLRPDPARRQPIRGEQCGSERVLSTNFGRSVPVDLSLDVNLTRTMSVLSSGNGTPKSIRLAIRAQPVTGSDWTLRLRDSGLRLLSSMSAADFAATPNGRIWTGRFDVSQVAAELVGARPGESVMIESAILYDDAAQGGSLFSTAVEGVPNWQPLSSMQSWREAQAGDAVGMMVGSTVDAAGAAVSWCCSGVMLTAELYLTNWHCGGNAPSPGALLWDTDIREATLIDLAWDGGSRNRQYRVTKVAATSEDLDYAILRVVPTKGRGGDDVPVEGARLALRAPVTGEPAFLIHHPVCEPKRISLVNCTIGARRSAWRSISNGATAQSDFVHGCDTEAGSSGGALFDAKGNLVALHHLGWEMDRQCKPVRRENKAVGLDAILANVKAGSSPLYAEILSGGR